MSTENDLALFKCKDCVSENTNNCGTAREQAICSGALIPLIRF